MLKWTELEKGNYIFGQWAYVYKIYTKFAKIGRTTFFLWSSILHHYIVLIYCFPGDSCTDSMDYNWLNSHDPITIDANLAEIDFDDFKNEDIQNAYAFSLQSYVSTNYPQRL